MSSDAQEPRTVPLNARIEPELQTEIDRIEAEDARPGELANRSRTVRVLLWEAVKARNVDRQGQPAQSVAVDPELARRSQVA